MPWYNDFICVRGTWKRIIETYDALMDSYAWMKESNIYDNEQIKTNLEVFESDIDRWINDLMTLWSVILLWYNFLKESDYVIIWYI